MSVMLILYQFWHLFQFSVSLSLSFALVLKTNLNLISIYVMKELNQFKMAKKAK